MMTEAEYCQKLREAVVKVLSADNKYAFSDALDELSVAYHPRIRVKMGRAA